MKIKIFSKPASATNNKTGGWRTFKPNTDLQKCISCGTCVIVCPEGCIAMKKIKKYPKEKPITDYNYCKGCGVCATECPVKAITMTLDKK